MGCATAVDWRTQGRESAREKKKHSRRFSCALLRIEGSSAAQQGAAPQLQGKAARGRQAFCGYCAGGATVGKRGSDGPCNRHLSLGATISTQARFPPFLCCRRHTAGRPLRLPMSEGRLVFNQGRRERREGRRRGEAVRACSRFFARTVRLNCNALLLRLLEPCVPLCDEGVSSSGARASFIAQWRRKRRAAKWRSCVCVVEKPFSLCLAAVRAPSGEVFHGSHPRLLRQLWAHRLRRRDPPGGAALHPCACSGREQPGPRLRRPPDQPPPSRRCSECPARAEASFEAI